LPNQASGKDGERRREEDAPQQLLEGADRAVSAVAAVKMGENEEKSADQRENHAEIPPRKGVIHTEFSHCLHLLFGLSVSSIIPPPQK
jgi:hypothetical protein